MIKTLSTYNLIVPWVSPLTSATATAYTVNIYIWQGEKLTVPSTPEYSITKDNHASSTGSDRIQIGRLVNDFTSFIPNNSATMEELDTIQYWVKIRIEPL